jgi:hypothetical protein
MIEDSDEELQGSYGYRELHCAMNHPLPPSLADPCTPPQEQRRSNRTGATGLVPVWVPPLLSSVDRLQLAHLQRKRLQNLRVRLHPSPLQP